MMMTVSEAQAKLSDLIHHLTPGEEIVLLDNEHPVAKLVAITQQESCAPRKLGLQSGSVLSMATDFDAPLEDFDEYT